MKLPESMTDTEAELSGKAGGLLLMHVLPAYRVLCGSQEAAIAKINELLEAATGIEYKDLDAETVLYHILH